MAELKNIRGNYLAQKLGNFPLDCECLNYAQKRDDISQALGCIGGDRVLLSGFNADGSGLVFVKTNECPWGEVMPVKAGSGSTLHLVSEPVRVDFSAEDVFPEAYFDRYLEYGTVYGEGAENFPVSSFWKLRNNKVIYESLLAEMQAREAADSSLRQSVNSLSSSLSSEQTARDTAVQNLKETLLQQLRSEVSSASSTAASSLSAEVTALNKRIADLESALSAQISNAQNTADTAAEGLASTQYVNSQISTLTDKINTEITQRKTDDSTETADRKKADSTETAERKAADKAITEKVDNIEKSIVPKGVILMWSGRSDTIPTGWALCDGQYGTPNLVGRFVLGAAQEVKSGEQYQVVTDLLDNTWTGIAEHSRDRGGQKEVNISLSGSNIPKHRHEIYQVDFGIAVPLNKNGCPDGSADSGDGTNVDNGRGAYWRGISVETIKIGNKYNRKYTEDTGEGNPFKVDTMPPYYALCYIMKL